LTWFRKDKYLHWLEADSENVASEIVKLSEL